jgi:nucleoside-diphosphate-sugar epimerase
MGSVLSAEVIGRAAGTGYVGCHTVAALAGHGHQVRLLVRSRDRIAPALDPLGVAGADAVVGDIDAET